MTRETLLEKAFRLCLEKHTRQTDKEGKPYFMHPFRVAERCATVEEKIVALLHDTVEDTDVTPEFLLSEGFGQEIVDGILSVTRREGEDYFDFVRRAEKNPIGRVVKLHDLEDNMDIRRLDEIDDTMKGRLNRYIRAYRLLICPDGSDEPTESATAEPQNVEPATEEPVRKILTFRERAKMDREKAMEFLNRRSFVNYREGQTEKNSERLSVDWNYKEIICR